MNQATVKFQPMRYKANEPTTFAEGATLEEKIIAALRTVYDPEIPVNIYDLGLIYAIKTDDLGSVTLNMTLTSPHCPVAESLPAQVECAVKAIEDVTNVTVNLVWDPPWDKERMSDEAKLILDMY
ncbi:MAG: SUF system Fe-S cluster assembly protein [Gammaproteobacteria bacterium]|nr:SUF system Fe-S cluster assembly protein [Gammaproteobacteria bacterium]